MTPRRNHEQRRRPGRARAWVGTVAASASALLIASGALAFEPRTGCDVHTPRGAALGKSYRELCDLRVLEQLGTYTMPEPGDDVCANVPDPQWPFCVTVGPEDEPDRGYRYPLTATSGDFQQPADAWPVCVNDGVSVVVSDPTAAACPQSAPIQVGTCEPAGHFYERLSLPGSSRPGEVFYSFVHEPETCEPCAHDVVSAVATCRARCDRYFGSLRFAYDPDDSDDRGAWVLDTTSPSCTDALIPSGNPDCALHNTTLDGGEDEGRTPLDACRANCGPPDPTVPTHADGAPWVSVWSNKTGPEASQKYNHWHFVQYGRGWNPNDNLDNWLRSYTVNRDKPTAPASECKDLVGAYCNQVIPLNQGIKGLTKKRNECKANLPTFTIAGAPDWPNLFPLEEGGVEDPSRVALNLPGDARNEAVTCDGHCSATATQGCALDADCPSGETCLHDAAPDGNSDGFCTDLYRGNMLCPSTCYFRGNDGEYNSHHLCGAVEQTTNQACLGAALSVCNEVSATCTSCKDGNGQVVGCPTVTILSPAPDANGHAVVNGTSVAVVAVLQDGNGNYLTSSPSTEWTRTWTDGEESSTASGTLGWYFAWATQPICLGPGENTIELRLEDAWGNPATSSIVIDAPGSNPGCVD